MNWHSLGLDETIATAEGFVQNLVGFLVTKGIRIKEHIPLEEVVMQKLP